MLHNNWYWGLWWIICFFLWWLSIEYNKLFNNRDWGPEKVVMFGFNSKT
jgi:hypothetical protein